jgi:hypothetical protein
MRAANRLGERDRSARRSDRAPDRAAKLRRAPRRDLAADALRLLAGATAELPQHVGRADEPVLVRRVKHDGARLPAGARRRVEPEQRDVVEMNHVVLPAAKDRCELARLQSGKPGLLRQQRRDRSPAASEPVNRDPRMLRGKAICGGGMQQR